VPFSLDDLNKIRTQFPITPGFLAAWEAMADVAKNRWNDPSDSHQCMNYATAMRDAAMKALRDSGESNLWKTENLPVGPHHFGVYFALQSDFAFIGPRQTPLPTIIFSVGSGSNPLLNTDQDYDFPIKINIPGEWLPGIGHLYSARDIYGNLVPPGK
jgi:hypothetical protein